MNYNSVLIESSHPQLKVALLHLPAKTLSGNTPVLFIHGSSFPAELSFGFRMNGQSWMDFMSDHNYDTYAIDLVGYGAADRYPAVAEDHVNSNPPGRALSVYIDVDKAVNYMIAKTGHKKIILIGHSWGGSVAALYAEKYPEKIEKLVLFAPLVARHNKDKENLLNSPTESLTPAARVDAMQNLTPKGTDSRLEPELFNEWKKQWLQSDLKAVKADPTKVYFPAGPLQDIEDLKHGLSYYHPSCIKAPVMVVRGEWDVYPNDEDALNLLDSLTSAPEKKYVIIGRGTHVMHLEKSRHRLYDEVNNFIAGQEPLSNDTTHSIAVIFEVIPNGGKKEEYLTIAAKLKPELLKIDGFISIERYQSLTHTEKILSLSFWRDEKSILAWRNLEFHRQAQEKGRNEIFKDYHLRIAHVVRDYGMFERKETPSDSKQYHN
jgi:pimeloyl-ACP methyl ester carboxylesterase/heme-degrading monooxygenase HmoA